ncbi:hypothetical protein LWI28_016183 [Acer negundo]|uniref:Retrotransposon Copia-like N-terminal domain-containing protein n=1 Tax=Acer negundo TaxID=4023 RepID=A0AAD5I720_ACENE|nr:hypothetical protein LWI28_016183 [Acer negundo]
MNHFWATLGAGEAVNSTKSVSLNANNGANRSLTLLGNISDTDEVVHSDESQSTPTSDEPQSTYILTILTNRMVEVLTKASTPALTIDTSGALIDIKLDGTNYALWSQVVEMYIFGKDKLGYINGDFLQPPQTDPSFWK